MPDLFVALPPLGRVEHPLLTGQRIALIGVSAILYDDHAHYFEITRPRFWAQRADGTRSVGVGGIGGGIKSGENPLDCLRRQVQDSLGVRFRLKLTNKTALFRGGELAGWLDLPPHRKHPTPYLINLLPPQLGGPGQPDHLAIIAFAGRPQGQPQRRDLFGLLAVTHPALASFLEKNEWALEEIVAHPALTIDLEENLPAGCTLRPVATARALQNLIRQGIIPPHEET